jgi:hypothetical protein
MTAIIITILSNPTVQITLVTALLAGTTWLGKQLVGLIKAKAEGTKYETGLLKITTAVTNAVLTVEATLVPKVLAAKGADSPGGTKITDEEGAGLFDAAEKSVIAILGGDEKITKLCASMGMDRAMFDALLANMIEAAVQKLTK